MSPNLSRWILATLIFIGLGLVVSRAGLPTARWIMLGLLMLVFFFGGTSARRPAPPAGGDAGEAAPPDDAPGDSADGADARGELEEDARTES